MLYFVVISTAEYLVVMNDMLSSVHHALLFPCV